MRYDTPATPRLLLIVDDALGAIEGEALAAAARADVQTVWIGEPCPAFGAGKFDAVAAYITEDAGLALHTVIEAMDRAAEEGQGGILVIPPPLFDLALRLAPHPDIALVAQGDTLGQAAALGLALARRPVGLAQDSPPSFLREERPSADLRRLSEEAARIAQMLASLAGTSWGPIAEHYNLSAKPLPPDPQRLRAMIHQRRLRDRFFATDLFADPAWDMLLDLMAARLERVNVSVSSLCIAAAVPPTTALRWIKSLETEGLVDRVADPEDQRRIFIVLSDEGYDRMCAYLSAVDARR
ncbi:winged helix DNA-binding protein [Sphingomonas naphthae]|uniref:Winged helix DNA-binding protein n=1 Tax=Sphingomonas naphthae TaxID=1813468 RepID=A0ABY7TM99_9SPHN|nr:winged helix DNA-binding protein [Sphingomonas naphthae]WCT74358.1 winged helix DNA-binding protein [Sphingomonas naphthae]